MGFQKGSDRLWQKKSYTTSNLTRQLSELGNTRTDTVGPAEDLELEVQGNPDALIFKQARKAKLRATVCGGCGNVGFSVDNPKALWATYAHQKNPHRTLHKRSS